MLFNCPLSSDKADKLIELLELSSDQRVIDVGCGTGEFLRRVARRFGAHGVGVDIDSKSLVTARAALRDGESNVEFFESDIREYSAESQSFDCGICLAASHAYSLDEPAYPETLRGLSELVKPGGKILIGESYWIRPPESEYLDFVGEPIGTYRTHLENVELGMTFGLIPHYAITSNHDEWDDFEWGHLIFKESQTANDSTDAETQRMLQRTRDWKMAYLRWGRDTLGFAYYIFRKPLRGERSSSDR